MKARAGTVSLFVALPDPPTHSLEQHTSGRTGHSEGLPVEHATVHRVIVERTNEIDKTMANVTQRLNEIRLLDSLTRVLCDVACHMANVICVAGSEAVMATPVALLSESVLGWSIFTIVLLVILAFCWVYIRKYQSRQESEVISTITAICALAIALITSALLPVDIFLVSFMKYPNGTYKEWAANNVTRQQIEDTVLYGYYSKYLPCVLEKVPFILLHHVSLLLEFHCESQHSPVHSSSLMSIHTGYKLWRVPDLTSAYKSWQLSRWMVLFVWNRLGQIKLK
ncbi:Lysosomal cobalamin transport escort protein LMBD1 [Labeo rohita]|uniref:Lysosomal cobalamin transport escort protein LMBD1 n=1 Tax=Labeo rohita TaxID=84645 RepID=A0ABQ8M543_LABRO|nr:Lysosomal cobalamin transport escort protein LMBD1 [Labeo rohita]